MSARPTAAELVAAVADFLDNDVRTVGGQVGFHARVATNVLRIVERELLDDTPPRCVTRWMASGAPMRMRSPEGSGTAASTTGRTK